MNFLGEADRGLAQLCAGHGAAAHAKRLTLEGWQRGDDGLPHWGRALAVLACRLHEAVEIGSHRMLVARVTAASAGPARHPLLYQARHYHALGGRIEG